MCTDIGRDEDTRIGSVALKSTHCPSTRATTTPDHVVTIHTHRPSALFSELRLTCSCLVRAHIQHGWRPYHHGRNAIETTVRPCRSAIFFFNVSLTSDPTQTLPPRQYHVADSRHGRRYLPQCLFVRLLRGQQRHLHQSNIWHLHASPER
jgi:hypothetical protein